MSIMEYISLTGVVFALMAVFIILSFKTWIVWWHDRNEQEKRIRSLLDELPPLSNGRRPK